MTILTNCILVAATLSGSPHLIDTGQSRLMQLKGSAQVYRCQIKTVDKSRPLRRWKGVKNANTHLQSRLRIER